MIGLDLGSQVLKAVEISLHGDEPVLSGLATVEVPPGGDRAGAIAQLFQDGRFQSRQVVLSVAGQSVVVRYISMMEMSDGEFRQAIGYELDKYLPFDRDDVVLDCQRLTRRPHGGGEEGAAQKQMTVVLAACRTTALQQLLREVAAQSLTPVAVDVDAFALANAWELSGVLTGSGDERPIALVDVGASRTQINVMAGRETCFSREIGIGGGDMTQAVVRRLNLEPAEAETVKRAPGERAFEVGRAIVPVLEDLTSEISISLDYVEGREGLGVEEVLLSGGAVQAPGVAEFLASSTGRSVRTWSPLSGLRVQEDRVATDQLERLGPSLAVAIGLASRVRAK